MHPIRKLSALILYALATAFVHGGWVALVVVLVIGSAFPAVVIGDNLRRRR